MASFTDTQPPKFNPYIQQQPVEAMVTVGMQKQKSHDEGVQKIQTQIDNLAGIDVVRDVDKAYLQSKINELGNSLNSVAAGDFSNFQLVNSVGGMIKQVSQDGNVKNAVNSAAKYRKELGLLEKDVEAGKENPANTAHFSKHASKWLNSSDLKQGFNTKYVTPKDVWGKIKDIAKEVGVDEQTVQQLYQTDEQGNTLVGKDGKPIWNKIMVEKTLKGKDAGKILKAFEMGLTSADYQQLAINGEYQNAGLDGAALKARINTDASEQIKFNDDKLQDLRVALLQETQKNDKNPDRIQSINDQIEYFEDKLEKVKVSRDNSMKKVDENPDAVRGSLYTNDYMYTMSKSLASQDVSTKYSVSPMFEVTMKENEFNRQVQRDKIADYHWSVEQQNEMLKAAGEREDKALELYLKYGVKVPGLKIPGGADRERLEEGIPEMKKEELKAAVEEDYSNSVQQLNANNYDLTLQYFKEINPRRTGEDDDAFDKRMRHAIDVYARANKEQAADIRTGDVNTFTARFAGKQLESWKQDPKSVPQEFRNLIANQTKLSKDVELKREKIKQTKKEAIQIAKDQGLTVLSDKEIKDNIQETDIYLDPNKIKGTPLAGQTVHLSKQDVTDFASLHPEIYNTFGSWTIDDEQESRQGLARKRLELKYGKNLKALDNYIHDARVAKGEMGGTSTYYGKVNPVIKRAGEFMNGNDYSKLAKIESQIYVDKGVISQPSSILLYRGEEKPEDFSNRISGVVDKYVNDGKVLASDGLTNEDLQAAIIGDDKKAVKIISYPGIGNAPATHVLRITTPKGKTLEVNIDRNDYSILSRTEAPENVPIPQVIEKLNYSGTTNTSGSPKGAWWSSNDFTNLNSKKYTVTGDLVKDKASSEVHMKIYVYNKLSPHDPPIPLTFPKALKTTNDDGSYNTSLDHLPAGITESMIEQIRKQ